MKLRFFILLIFLLAADFSAQAGLSNAVYWNFFETASPASNSFTGLSVADVTRVNGGGGAFLNNSTPSSGYTTSAGFLASGGTNVAASTVAGTLNLSSSTFFATAFTLDLSSSALAVTNVALGSRSTGTGPQFLFLYASTNGFSSDFESLGNVAVTTNSAWAAVQFTGLSLDLLPGETLSFRLYGSEGTSTAANWKIDDLSFALSPVPEPAAVSLCFTGGLICWASLRRKFKK